LRLIALPKSCQVHEGLHPKDEDLASSVAEAIAYAKTNPPSFAGPNLVNLGERLAAAVKGGRWEGNRASHYNERRDKALILLEFNARTDAITYTATFHDVGGL